MVDILTHVLYSTHTVSHRLFVFFGEVGYPVISSIWDTLPPFCPFSSVRMSISYCCISYQSALLYLPELHQLDLTLNQDITRHQPTFAAKSICAGGERDRWDFLRIWHLIYTVVQFLFGMRTKAKQKTKKGKTRGNKKDGRIVHVSNQARKRTHTQRCCWLIACLLILFIVPFPNVV
jgi:hypothetical protein